MTNLEINRAVHEAMGESLICKPEAWEWDYTDSVWLVCRKCDARELHRNESHEIPVPDYCCRPELFWPLLVEWIKDYRLHWYPIYSIQALIELITEGGPAICLAWLKMKGVDAK
jgi:hypothetical protein